MDSSKEQKTMSNKGFYTIPFVWNRKLWVMTFAFFVLWIGVSGYMLYEVCTTEQNIEEIISLIIFNVVMLPTMLLCEGYAPQRLEVGESQIVILRRYNSVTILRSIIIAIEPLSAKDKRWTANLGGCGGLFGYFGRFSNRRLGEFTMYATAMDNLYLITTADGKKWVINCSEPDLLQKK